MCQQKEIKDFRYRQIHLDFHTSEHISGVGAKFDANQFVDTLKHGEVDSVTLFARCHHGWSYYPTNVGTPHPNLQNADLLGDMVKACADADIATPIYLTVQWDELTAREHPEWRVMQAQNTAANYPGTEPSAMNQLTPTWHTLCLNHEGAIQRQIDIGLEVCARYNPPALFMDILASWECTCNACLSSMKAAGMDPMSADDRKSHDKRVLMTFFERFSKAINGQYPDVRIFFNSGHIYKGQDERYQYYGHLELESLPTGGWGYDHFPVSARYADTLNLPFLGMTGRFHTHWGEFGGFKRADALTYECCLMVSLGARCSIGDQLHPNGHMDFSTYDLIRPAYTRVKALEPYAYNATYQREVAILSVEAQVSQLGSHLGHRSEPSDAASARMLLEMQIPFDLIASKSSFDDYKLIILPDSIRLDEDLAARLKAFTEAGGSILATGESGLDVEGKRYLLDIGAELAPTPMEFDPSYLSCHEKLDEDMVDASVVMYEKGAALYATDGDVLADVRPSYFNRTWDKFCSHLHTPEDPDADPLGPAILQKGRVAYVAYPLFRMYGTTGQPLYKYLIRGLISRLLPQQMIGTELPSAARLSLMEQKAEERQVLHVLYAPTQLRGSGIAYNDGQTRAIEIIEDAPELKDAKAWVRTETAPADVTCAYTGKTLPWSYDGLDKKLHIVFPSLHIHGAAVISYADVKAVAA
ncbi:alpha-amylase family protein [Pseudovibrio sp. Tun.PSC04-5.I4]|uniref:alpha-amylase family protein n=1 Tax=Pseudovibrio sp. Tun.PSC04-5.I4 TaxID=1798213 RepID=UPI00088F5C2C|nr:alpha-amylase family protein [Pseudovibrio sp. Tun.PSC04-5.I4]SDR47947.1 Beta-galactosidase trimerisation domain-containing protein [Pseudovibrio sp. Tun.PSC04-5.I4]